MNDMRLRAVTRLDTPNAPTALNAQTDNPANRATSFANAIARASGQAQSGRNGTETAGKPGAPAARTNADAADADPIENDVAGTSAGADTVGAQAAAAAAVAAALGLTPAQAPAAPSTPTDTPAAADTVADHATKPAAMGLQEPTGSDVTPRSGSMLPDDAPAQKPATDAIGTPDARDAAPKGRARARDAASALRIDANASAPERTEEAKPALQTEAFKRTLEALGAHDDRTAAPATVAARSDAAAIVAAPAAPSATYSLAHTRVATPLLHPGFGHEFADRVVFLAGQRVQSAEISITPVDLGPVSVAIEVRGQEASLSFGAVHATTRAAIEDALPRLREMLADSGLQLTNAFVGDHARRDSHHNGAARTTGTVRSDDTRLGTVAEVTANGTVTAAKSMRLVDVVV
jgi:flagellar hook-length control protein FliK